MTDINPFQGDTADQAPVVLASARGLRNNNPGNIKISGIQWNGQVPGNDPTFATFDTPESGIAALAKNLVAYQKEHGINTIAGLVRRWAPSSDNNNVNAYIKSISEQTGIGPNDKLNLSDPDTLSAIVPAIIQHENGKNPYGSDTVMGGINYALNGINPSKVQWDSGSDSGQPQDLGGVKVQQGTVDPFAGDKSVVSAQPAPQAPVAQPRAATPAPLAIDPTKVQWDAPAQSGNTGGMSHHYDANGRLVIDDNTPGRSVPAKPAPTIWQGAPAAGPLGNNLMDGLHGIGNAVNSLVHGITSPLDNAAQTIEHGIQWSANKIAPNSAIAQYINKTVANDDSVLGAYEKAYQDQNKGSIVAPVMDFAGNVIGMGPRAIGLIGKGNELAQAGGQAMGLSNPIIQKVLGAVGSAGGASTLGALSAATAPVANPQTNFWQQKGEQAKIGAELGPVFAAVGGAAGGAGKLAGKAKSTYQALKAPFTEAGREQIAANKLMQFVNNPQQAINNALGFNSSIEGYQAPLSEITKDIGVAQLQNAMRSADPLGFGQAIAQRDMANNGARVGALQGIAGDEASRAEAVANRQNAVEDLYKQAYPQPVQVDDTLQSLLQRPAMQKALTRAQKLADEQGGASIIHSPAPTPDSNLGTIVHPSTTTGQGLQYVKQALDDMLNDPRLMGNEKAALQNTRQGLIDWMENKIPEFAQARTSYGMLSKPVNQMDVGQRLLNQYTTGTRDLAGQPKLQANAFNKALRNEGTLVQRATGFGGVNSMSDVMTPGQMQTLNEIADQLSTKAAVDGAGKAPGSPTAQNLVTEQILKDVLPGWLHPIAGNVPPEAMGTFLGSHVGGPVGSVAGMIAGKALSGLYKTQNEAVVNRLSEMLLNPDIGIQAMQRGALNGNGGFLASQPARNLLIQRLMPYFVPGAIVSGSRALAKP